MNHESWCKTFIFFVFATFIIGMYWAFYPTTISSVLTTICVIGTLYSDRKRIMTEITNKSEE